MYKNLIKYFLFLSFLFAFLTGWAQNKISLRVEVRTNDGQKAPEVFLQLKGSSRTGITGGDGTYTFTGLNAGAYTIEATLTGYKPARQEVILASGETASVNLQIEASNSQLKEVIVSSGYKYKSLQSDYANKMPLSNLENPQAITTITKDLIKDQVLFTVDDALRNVAGMQKMWDATGRAGDGGAYYALRGFPTQATMRNGLASMITTTTDAANIEKVEILKGPSATLYGSALTTYGGVIDRITKKPYDKFGGEVNVSGGSYDFLRASADINAPLDNAKKILFRFNGAYNTQGSFQRNTGTGNRFFAAPSLLIKPNDKLSISLDAELTYAKTVPGQFIFLYFSGADLGFNRADKSGLDYKESYVGKGIKTTSRSSNYFGNANYKISDHFASSTNLSYSRSYSDGRGQYFFQIPNYMVTQNPADAGTVSHYLARADQSTRNARNNIFEVQQYFNGDFAIGSLKNRFVLGLDYTNINSNQIFYSPISYIDIVPTDAAGYDYTNFNGAYLNHYYDTATDASVQQYPIVSKTNIYSAFASEVLNITDNLEAIAALRVDHYDNKTYKQTALSPKFGLVYQPIKDHVSLFANYQNSFSNQGAYSAYDESTGSIVSKDAKPEHANQWEAGVKTNLVKNKLTATLSYYNIRVDDIMRTDPRNPANAQIQNGTEVSRGVELELNSNPFKGFSIFGGIAYNDSKYKNISDDLDGYRTQYSGSPWLANWWLNYQFDHSLQGFNIGFGGNYANDNKLVDSKSSGTFIIPAYTVLNASIGYDRKHYRIAFKVDNLNNEHYWTGYSTYNPQMLRQFVGSIFYKF